MAQNKTKETDASVADYLASIQDKARRDDCIALTKLMQKASNEPPKMWGSNIVGFGTHHYKYDSGREGEICAVGFASRKNEIAIYGLRSAPDADRLMAKLGKHKQGKGCMYVRRLADVDAAVLEKLVAGASRSKGSAA